MKAVATIKPKLRLWKIKGSPSLTTMLLPAPGTVGREGAIAYPVGPSPGTQVLTLQAQDETGAMISRAVEIVAIAPPSVVQPPSSVDSGAEARASASSPEATSASKTPGSDAEQIPPPIPEPPGGTQPVDPGINAPPPAEGPPRFN